MQPTLTSIFSVTPVTFDQTALAVYRYQYEQVPIYRAFCDGLKRTPAHVNKLDDIPFLPIQFFKTHKVLATEKNTTKIFESSTTTGGVPSRHYVADLQLYEHSFQQCFQQFYGTPRQYVVLALLPSYMERGTSSLLYMADWLIRASDHHTSCFIGNDFSKLCEKLEQCTAKNERVLLLGVTYALLDFATQFPMKLPHVTIMETGGMKGRRDELTRENVHQQLCAAFGVSSVHSEYGMTELLSQAYAPRDGIFECPPWMRVIARDTADPLRLLPAQKNGALNVIDLANVFSCAFLATQDVGQVFSNGKFTVLGRLDNSDVRGCNLLYL